MMDAQLHLQKLLPIFHHSPLAMVEANAEGKIRQVNPKAVQLMMPLATYLDLPGTNIIDTLSGFIPAIRGAIADFYFDSGLIIDQEPYIIHFAYGQSLIERHFSLTIEKITPDSLLFFFDDVTDFLVKADALRHRS
ncbi:hypothetical protein [Fibrella forsythiae]|uniref:Uncharacterized protein n=1 Tax=Fibrella forsythiae TaxID=2817061 RepID=A0ABS3JTL4_9BACT|nr:hypothetical protein [Fibrella forsythiae]MBO0952783.1 hypothetical protein [Fibrella forsythiae]